MHPSSQNFKGNLLSGVLNILGWEILHISPFISETVQDRPILWNTNKKS